MRARTLTSLTLLALGTAVAWPHVASADSPRTIRLDEHIVSFTQTDVGETGVSPGDRATFRTELFDQRGRKVGFSPGECVSAAPAKDTLGLTHCTLTYVLKGGQLAAMGVFDFNSTGGVMSIVGGNGKYRGASGQVDFLTTKDPAKFKLTIRLDR